jgi:hypothetical protein
MLTLLGQATLSMPARVESAVGAVVVDGANVVEAFGRLVLVGWAACVAVAAPPISSGVEVAAGVVVMAEPQPVAPASSPAGTTTTVSGR